MKLTNIARTTIKAAAYPFWRPFAGVARSLARQTASGSSILGESKNILVSHYQDNSKKEERWDSYTQTILASSYSSKSIAQIPQSRKVYCAAITAGCALLLACIFLKYGARTTLPLMLPFSCWLFLLCYIYKWTSNTKLFIDDVIKSNEQESEEVKKTEARSSFWYRFYLGQKRVFLSGLALMAVFSVINLVTDHWFMSCIQLIIGIVFFGLKVIICQFKLWRISTKRITVKEKGDFKYFMKESNWFTKSLNPEFFNRF